MINSMNILQTGRQQSIISSLETTANGIEKKLPEILFITSFPPRECGIATYSQDLVTALTKKFNQTFKIRLCALESENEMHNYTEGFTSDQPKIKYILNTDQPNAFIRMARIINRNDDIKMVLVQHEFGFFENREVDFKQFLNILTKPVVIVFHTVLPHPDDTLKMNVQQISSSAGSIIVMTNSSAEILINDYGVSRKKITVIQHGTHLVIHSDQDELKRKYNLTGKKVLSTFGLLSSGKSIETSLNALPMIIKENPDVMFLVIGKTHPTVVLHEGEKYRKMLEEKVEELQIKNHVKFINQFLPLPILLEYLQLTDIYLFTSKDPNQAVSGTFSYAISCGCPIVSTAIPHAREVLKNDAGMIIGFEDPQQLADAVNKLLDDEQLRKNIGSNGLHRMASTAWENTAIAHARLFEKNSAEQISLEYTIPEINLEHIKKLTTDFGMIQFSKINQPDLNSGYTLDDNARAMISMCLHYETTGDINDLLLINTYLNFIEFCIQPNGRFLNYVNDRELFTIQNNESNLDDANGRAVWALGFLISNKKILPKTMVETAIRLLDLSLNHIEMIHSTRAIAFAIKGISYYHNAIPSASNIVLTEKLANRLERMYAHECEGHWKWFETYLTYGNSILPEGMLCAYLITKNNRYKEIAKASFDFLLLKIFQKNSIHVISNKGWLHKSGSWSIEEGIWKTDPATGYRTKAIVLGGEQPIDVAYTILAMAQFYKVFEEETYLEKMKIAFSWFLGNNHLHQIIYNPRTGGCYDGLEEHNVNLNQGAESTISYLMARLTVEKYLYRKQNKEIPDAHFLASGNQMQLA